MCTPFAPLLEAGQFDKCRELAEKTLCSSGYTTREAAQCHHALARCCLAENDSFGSVRCGEAALPLAVAAQDGDLEALVLVDLASAYGRLHRYPKQALVLKRYLGLLHRLDWSRSFLLEAWFGVGVALYRSQEFSSAIHYLTEGLLLAQASGRYEMADHCRRILRKAMIRAQVPAEIPDLLTASKAYVVLNPDDRAAQFGYSYDLAEYSYHVGSAVAAVRHALRALDWTVGSTEDTVACFLLLQRCAWDLGNPEDSMGFALAARMQAIEDGRHDLAFEATHTIIDLLGSVSHPVLDACRQEWAANGLDLLRYVPERLFEAGTNNR